MPRGGGGVAAVTRLQGGWLAPPEDAGSIVREGAADGPSGVTSHACRVRAHPRAGGRLSRSTRQRDCCRARCARAWLAADSRHRAAYQQLLEVDEHASAVLDDPELQAATARDLELLTPASARRRRWPWLLLSAMLVAAIAYAVNHLLMQ